MAELIKTAILSVSNKSGLAEFARHLAQMGVRLYATCGTLRALEEVEIRAIPVGELTQFPEMMDGCIKTLHPAVFAGILARRGHKKDMDTLAAHQMEPIDMVVVNLRAFRMPDNQESNLSAEQLHDMDIGGVALLRAAAKNYRHVAPIVNPVDYEAIIEEMLAKDRQLGEATRLRLATQAIERCLEYDRQILDFLKNSATPPKD